MLSGGGWTTLYCFKSDFDVKFSISLKFLSKLNNIFQVKGLKRFTFHVKLIVNMRKRPKKKNIE